MRLCSYLLVITSLVLFTGCGSSRRALPLPPIQHAPPGAAELRIFVMNASHEAARLAGETTVTGYTIMMREAVQRSLIRAGYTVTVRSTEPHDLEARVEVTGPSLERPGTATMMLLTPKGVVVEQISGIIGLDENVDIDERGPVALIESLAQSQRLWAFARDHKRGACETVPLEPQEQNPLQVPAESLPRE